ncbi:MAG: hypothetical protein IT580_12775 [Verrucomicrobiales bacterium]|nr:hypothetical protein [Verrucomicrobiales bacterium]
MRAFLLSHPGLLVSLLLVVGGTLVCGLLGFFMKRSGASLRPILWFASLFGLIVLPQFAFHLTRAISGSQSDAPRAAALKALEQSPTPSPSPTSQTTVSATPQPPRPRAEAAKELFGPDVDPALILDARAMFGDALAQAESAHFAAFPSGESVLIAKFPGPTEAEQAWVNYLRFSGLSGLPGKGDSHRGFAVTRPVGDRLYAVPLHSVLWVGSGPDDASLRRRLAAGGFQPPDRAPLEGVDPAPEPTTTHDAAAGPRSDWSPLTRLGLGVALAAYMLFVVAFFLKGASWAGTTPAAPHLTPVPRAELESRLQAINQQEVPYHVEALPESGEWSVTWRYADARWVDFARVHGQRGSHRLVLRFDEAAHRVRVTEYAAAYDWSAGAQGARIEWKYLTGITFFHVEHRQVLGLQLDGQDGSRPKISAGYRFNLPSLKAPLIEVVTRAGWEWRPVAWNAPTWLRWLTE